MSIESSPLVTIGMPVYNGEKYIVESIESILKQTYSEFELIISDNASTDNTEKICKDYLKKDERIKYNRFKENLGASKNYNYLVGEASGKYFRWSNDDDLWDPINLEKCVEVLNRDPSVILVYPKTKIIDENGEFVRNYDDNLDLHSSDAAERFIHYYKNIGLSNVLYGLIRTDILRKTSLFGNYIASDITLIGELSLYGKFHEIKEYYFSRRFHSKSSSSDQSNENQQMFFDPKTVGKLAFPLLRHPYQNFISVLHSPLNSSIKARLYYFIFRTMVSNRNRIGEEFYSNIKGFYLRWRCSR